MLPGKITEEQERKEKDHHIVQARYDDSLTRVVRGRGKGAKTDLRHFGGSVNKTY